MKKLLHIVFVLIALFNISYAQNVEIQPLHPFYRR